MVNGDSTVHTVSKGDTLWKVAKTNLTKSNQGDVTNGQIVEEMKRLARVNGYDDYETFSRDYFSSTGKTFNVGDESPVEKPTNIYRGQTVNSPVSNSGFETYTIKQNDTLWAVAKRNCGSNPSDIDVIAEMQRLAKLNGYDDYNEFSRKCFNTVGKTIKISEIETIKEELPVDESQLSQDEQYAQEINSIPSTKDRIIEYNKTNGNGFYAIIDKKTCTLTLYDQDGNIVKDDQGNDIIIPVGVGKFKGDNLMFGYAADKDDPIHEQGRYTAAGEFTLDELDERVRSEQSIEMYGNRVMDLKGDNRGEQSAQMAFHQVPVNFQGESNARTNALRNDRLPNGTLNPKRNLSDNRMSYGCVNLLPEDYDLVSKYLGEGKKVYILPEEKGNELRLEQQANGEYKFVQLYHRDQTRDLPADEASRVDYDKHPLEADSFWGWCRGVAYMCYNEVASWFS